MAAALLVGRSALSWAPEASLLTLWAGMGVAICAAIARARPAGLLRFKATDILWGVGVGLLLRTGAGAISGVNISSFPTTGSLDGSVPIRWWWTQAVPAALVAPVVEELFFRAVVLVAVYQILRRSVGPLTAGLTAALSSAGTFVLLHAAFAAVEFVSGLELFALGMVCSATVLLTGRIWGAVLIHAVYNATFVALTLIGTATF
ncbi:CPBP family intramembrane glutamic endopeptidase [Microbacterium sp. SL75]|uniref:CPBP family intramembrane glutamic endopeptidase n=1 Tax=Microbacterium sp. SL75 TaxID=2995140 RepID=UPI00226E4806|nr:CPBP family intramembrane glutamic endopeptidase [Microbacterium sp. SL75]WAC68499.1 CPBP family intramembrane metalloprotease [Microbacterium sp. SL75]